MHQSEPSRRDRKARRAELLKLPCIYCGGATPATTTDHMPSRSLFNGAAWPEGYEFPACGKCQHVSRYAETMVGFLAHIYSDPAARPSASESKNRIAGLRRNYPGVYANLLPSKEKLRAHIAKNGPLIDPVTGRPSLRAMSLDHPEVHEAVRIFGVKLACALHYTEARCILPPNAAIHVRWYSNVQLAGGNVPAALIELNGYHRKLVRANRVLNNQFTYSSVVCDDASSGIYVATFRRSFAMQLSVVRDCGAYPELKLDDWSTPFGPNGQGQHVQ